MLHAVITQVSLAGDVSEPDTPIRAWNSPSRPRGTSASPALRQRGGGAASVTPPSTSIGGTTGRTLTPPLAQHQNQTPPQPLILTNASRGGTARGARPVPPPISVVPRSLQQQQHATPNWLEGASGCTSGTAAAAADPVNSECEGLSDLESPSRIDSPSKAAALAAAAAVPLFKSKGAVSAVAAVAPGADGSSPPPKQHAYKHISLRGANRGGTPLDAEPAMEPGWGAKSVSSQVHTPAGSRAGGRTGTLAAAACTSPSKAAAASRRLSLRKPASHS